MLRLIRKIVQSIFQRVINTASLAYRIVFGKYKVTQVIEQHPELPPPLHCVISYNKYGGYCIPWSARHRPAVQNILSGGVYEEETIEYVRSHCGEGDVVHAGTFFGDFLPALSSSCGAGNKVFAFEPNPESYRCASITIAINALHNIDVFNAALGAVNEKLPMVISDRKGRALGGASKLLGKNFSNVPGKKEMVQIFTLDEIVPQSSIVSIIQLDVEGHEKEALIGGLRTIQRCLPIIVLEVRTTSTLLECEWFKDNILGFGYKRSETINENVIFIATRAKQVS